MKCKGDGRMESPYNGSPLDLLPCPPSMLLYTYDYYGCSPDTKHHVQRELVKSEMAIKRRSIAIESKWSTDKLKPASIGIIQTKILAILDILDKHCYDLTYINDTIETLYVQIFPKLNLLNADNSKREASAVVQNGNHNHMDDESSSIVDNDGQLHDGDADNDYEDAGDLDQIDNELNRPLSDKEIIYLLIDWATTTRRCGLHRIFYAVFLIKKRQIDLITQAREANRQLKLKAKLRTAKIKLKQRRERKRRAMLIAKRNHRRKLAINSRKRKLKLDEDNNGNGNNVEIDMETGEMADQPPKSQSAESAPKKIKLEHQDEDDIPMSVVVSDAKLTTTAKPPLAATLKCGRKKLDLKKKNAITGVNNRRRVEREKKARLKLIKEKNARRREIELRLERKMYEFPFQKILVEYLETKCTSGLDDVHTLFAAPASTANTTGGGTSAGLNQPVIECKINFASLISLYHMFVYCKIFSHDQFVCDLIAKGEHFRNNLNDIKRPISVFLNHAISKQQKLKEQQQQQQLQQQSKQPFQSKTQINNSFSNKRNSIDYPSPMSNLYQQPPASMPPYNHGINPPLTPLPKGSSGGGLAGDQMYMAPNSVPTPSRSSSSLLGNNAHMDDPGYPQLMSVTGATGQNLNTSYENITNRQPASNQPVIANAATPGAPQSASKQAKLTSQMSVSQLPPSTKTQPSSDQPPTVKTLKPLSKLAYFVLHLPLPTANVFQHERNQRFIILYGFGDRKLVHF